MRVTLLSLLCASTLLVITTASFATPIRSTKANYGGTCHSDDAIYVEGDKWWKWEFGLGPGTGWQYGGKAKRINADQIIIIDEVYTKIGSRLRQCRPL